MSERYRASQLKRDWVARLRAGEKPVDHQRRAIDEQTAFEKRRPRSLAGSLRLEVLCAHGVDWQACTVCSKPRAR